MKPIKQMVCGFIFDNFGGALILTDKNLNSRTGRKLNGIGGKVFSHESPAAAMARICTVEGFLDIPREKWVRYHVERHDKGDHEIRILYYAAKVPEEYINLAIAMNQVAILQEGEDIATGLHETGEPEIERLDTYTYNDVLTKSFPFAYENVPYLVAMARGILNTPEEQRPL